MYRAQRRAANAAIYSGRLKVDEVTEYGKNPQDERGTLEREAKTDMMMDGLRRIVDAGFGALSLTRERAEALVDDLVKKGEVGGEEREHLIRQLVSRGQTERQALGQFVNEQVGKVMHSQPLATKQDLEAMEARLTAAIRQLQDLMAAEVPSPGSPPPEDH